MGARTVVPRAIMSAPNAESLFLQIWAQHMADDASIKPGEGKWDEESYRYWVRVYRDCSRLTIALSAIDAGDSEFLNSVGLLTKVTEKEP